MPKSPRKKNQVSIWFNAILRETVRGETVSEETVTVNGRRGWTHSTQRIVSPVTESEKRSCQVKKRS